jgi:ribulose-phosphate 3-epimerase
MKKILAPSILSADFSILGQQVRQCVNAGAGYIHIDVMDGVFVPSLSFGFPIIRTLRPCTDAVFDVHLMITDPIRYIDEFAEAGADIITFHLEAAPDPQAVIDAIHRAGKKAGMSIKPATPVSALEPYVDQLDMILIMSIEPGFGGQKYIESSSQKLTDLRRMLDDNSLTDLDIEVDGGVNADNIGMITDAGANIIVAGSAVFKGNIEENAALLLHNMEGEQ